MKTERASELNTVGHKYATTEPQLELWLASQQSDEANCAYNELCTLILKGDLNVAALEAAIEKSTQRHESLRTTFSVDGSTAFVHSNVKPTIEHLDFSAISDSEKSNKLSELTTTEGSTSFDLENGPLVRFVIQKLSATEHHLLINAHHIILDGWSLAVLANDIGHFYDGECVGNPVQLPPANQYAEYSQQMSDYMNSENATTDEAFWLSQFNDEIPVLDLPVKDVRPGLRTYSASRHDHQFPAELMENLRKIGAKSGCSLFNTMLASFQAFIARLSGNHDFCLGIPTAGQASMDCLELVGHCVNTMPLRTKVPVDAKLTDYMKQSRGELLNSFDHQNYSFGTLLRKLAPPRDPSRPPMVAISFNLDPALDTTKMGYQGLELEVRVDPRAFENFEWFVNGVINADKSVELQVQYNTDLFSQEQMEFYFEGFEAFLGAVVDRPEAIINELPMMSIEQRKKVIVDWNSTPLDYPTDSCLHNEFSKQAAKTPNKVAVEFDGQSLTYLQLDQRSNQIARFLQQQGVSAGDLVGICVERSHHMVEFLYGIMKSGAGYVPLDPAYPSDRLEYMCDHSGLKLVVTESNLEDIVKSFNKPTLAIDERKTEIEALETTAVDSKASSADTCYVIYTSGSTGKPKGVNVPHGPVVNFLRSMQKEPGFGENDSILAITTLSFDIAVLELYLPTTSGGTVHIASQSVAMDGSKIVEKLDEHNISLMQATPATWRMMIQSGWKGNKTLKVLCGGEPMPEDLVGPLLERCGELWNMYGPTETTVWSAVFQITDANDPILIGKPIGNTQIYILDSDGNEVPVGCEGEVFIGGAGVTHGYLHHPEMTSERFLDHRYFNPFASYVSNAIYKTGDVARYTFDGNIQFLHRNDKQVKVRGFRIELGEIEQALKTHPAVQQNVVIVREDQPGDTKLAAYYVSNSNEELDIKDLREHLQASLPFHMVPQYFIEMFKLPQTNNGKIDYKALPAPNEDTASQQHVSAPPQTDSEKYLAGVWQEVLEVDEIGMNDNFFELGGHSLQVMQVINRVEEKTEIRLSPQDFLMSTLEQISEDISGQIDLESEKTNQQESDSLDLRQNATEETENPKKANKRENELSKNGVAGKVSRSIRGFWN